MKHLQREDSMTDKRDDGGPAYPNITPDMNVVGSPGLSIRDWFAGQALPALMTGILTTRAPYDRETAASVAKAAYGQADALLSERAKERP